MSYTTTYHGQYREPKETPVSDFIGEVFHQYISQSWTGRLVYGLLVVAFIKIMLVPLGGVAGYLGEEQRLQKVAQEALYQEMLPEDMEAEIRAIGAELSWSTERTPQWYYQTLARIVIAETAVDRGDFERTSYIPTDDAAIDMLRSQLDALTVYRYQVQKEYGKAAYNAAFTQYLQPVHGNADVSDQMSDFNGLSLWKNAYFWSMIVIFCHFAIQIKSRGASFRLEVCSSRFWLWLTLWPLGIIKYPHNISIAEQARRALRFATMMISGLMAMLPIANAQTKGSNKSANEGTHPIVWVMDIEQVDDPLSRIQSSEPVDEELDNATEAAIADPDSNVIRFVPSKAKTRILPDVVIGSEGNETRVQTLGWLRSTCSSDALVSCRKIDMARLRVIASNGQLRFFSQTDLLNGNLGDGSMFNQLWLGKKFENGLELRAGQVFLTAGLTTRPPFLQETITPARIPVAFSGVGLQLTGSVTDALSFSVDVTGKPNAPAFSNRQFDALASSGALKYTLENGFVRATAFQSDDLRLIFDGEWQSRDFLFRGALHHRTGSDQTGGYVYGEYRGLDRFVPMAQLDQVDADFQSVIGFQFELTDRTKLITEFGDETRFRVMSRF